MKANIHLCIIFIFCFTAIANAQKKPEIKCFVDETEYVKKNTIVSDQNKITLELIQAITAVVSDTTSGARETAASIYYQIDSITIKVIPYGTRKQQKDSTKVFSLSPSELTSSPSVEIELNKYMTECTNKITISFKGVYKRVSDTSLVSTKYKAQKPYKFLQKGLEPESCTATAPKEDKPWWKFW